MQVGRHMIISIVTGAGILMLLTGCGHSDGDGSYRVDPALAAELPRRADIDAIPTMSDVTDYSTVLPTAPIPRLYLDVREGPVGYAEFELRAADSSPPADFVRVEALGPPRKRLFVELLLYQSSSSKEALERWHDEPPIKTRTRSFEADLENATVSRSEALRNGRVLLPTPDGHLRYTWCASFRDPDHPVKRCGGVHFWMRRCSYLVDISLSTDPLADIDVYDPSLAATAEAIAARTAPSCPEDT